MSHTFDVQRRIVFMKCKEQISALIKIDQKVLYVKYFQILNGNLFVKLLIIRLSDISCQKLFYMIFLINLNKVTVYCITILIYLLRLVSIYNLKHLLDELNVQWKIKINKLMWKYLILYIHSVPSFF